MPSRGAGRTAFLAVVDVAVVFAILLSDEVRALQCCSGSIVEDCSKFGNFTHYACQKSSNSEPFVEGSEFCLMELCNCINGTVSGSNGTVSSSTVSGKGSGTELLRPDKAFHLVVLASVFLLTKWLRG